MMVIIVPVVIILGMVICGGVALVIIKVVLYYKRRHKLDINQSMLYIMYNVLCICVHVCTESLYLCYL